MEYKCSFSLVQLTVFNSKPKYNALVYVLSINTNLICPHNPEAAAIWLENRVTGEAHQMQKSWMAAHYGLP